MKIIYQIGEIVKSGKGFHLTFPPFFDTIYPNTKESGIGMKEYRVCAVIVAAGKGERMGCDKMMLPLEGIPCIARTMLAFQKAETVNSIVAVTRPEIREEIETMAREYGITKLAAVTGGGGCRQESVLCGVAHAPAGTEFYCIHDGARPFVKPEEIDRVNRAAFDLGGAFCGTRVKDTIKKLDGNGYVVKTPKRADLVAAATPQTFDAALYRNAAEMFRKELSGFTDDASIFEAAGLKVGFVECSYGNIKITTPEDMAVAEKIMSAYKKDGSDG